MKYRNLIQFEPVIAHLGELRQRALQGEFHEYTKGNGRLNIFRSEAI